MNINIVFIIYIVAAFMVLLGIGLIMLLISKTEYRNSEKYKTVFAFVFAVFLDCLLYFYFYFSDMIIHKYSVAMPLRIMDYILYGAIPFFWICVMAIMQRLAETLICIISAKNQITSSS